MDGGKLKISTLPNGVYLPHNNESCRTYIQHNIKRRSTTSPKAYPTTVAQAVKWLQRAKQNNRYYERNAAILGLLQSRIDQHQKGDLYLLFGNNHNVIQHYQFFNELWTPGRDGLHLSGITHIALEAFVTDLKNKPLRRRTRRWMRKIWSSWRGRRQLLTDPHKRKKLLSLLFSSQQPLLDLYVLQGKTWAYHLLEVINSFLLGRSYPPAYLQELMRTVKLAREYPDAKGRKGRIQLLASDMSLKLRKQVRHLSCWVYALREIFSAQAIRARTKHSKRNVIAYMWGSDHIRKHHFPRYLPVRHKLYTILLQGGGLPDVWDRALLKLKQPMRMFAIETPGAKEGDIMIHFPPRGPWIAGHTLIGPVSQAHLVRSRAGGRMPRLTPLPQGYALAVNTTLQMMRRPLSYCYRKGKRKALVRLTIAPSGRIQRVKLLQHRKAGWSYPCIQRVLWRLPLPPPPSQHAMHVLFLLRYRPGSHR